MFESTVKLHFDAAHFHRNYEGKCANLHGHRWSVAVSVQAESLTDQGFVLDFAVLKDLLRGQVIERLDHTCINDVPPFDVEEPSAEQLAVTIYRWLLPHLPTGPARLTQVQVWEAPEQWAVYRP